MNPPVVRLVRRPPAERPEAAAAAVPPALRNRTFQDVRVVYTVGPLDERLTAALPEAFADVARDDPFRIASVRTRAGTAAGPARLDDLVAESIHGGAAPAGVGLVRSIAQRGSGPLGATLDVAADAATLTVEHGLADGNQALALLDRLLSIAAERPAPQVPPPARLPLLRAAAAAGPGAAHRYLRHHRTAPYLPPDLADARIGTDRFADASFVRLRIHAVQVARLRATGRGQRVSTTVAVIALAAAVLRRTRRDAGDPRVVLPVDLRRLLPGRSVSGNLIATEAAGTLFGSSWDPGAVAELLRRQVDLAAPRLLLASTRSLRGGGRRGVGEGQTERSVSISVQRASTPELAAPDVRVGIAAIAPAWPSATLASAVITASGDVTLSIWDDSGAFDLSWADEVVEDLTRA